MNQSLDHSVSAPGIQGLEPHSVNLGATVHKTFMTATDAIAHLASPTI